MIEVHHLPDDGAPDAASVVRLSDVLLELLHSGISLGEAQLAWLERIEPPRRGPLLEALTAIPSTVAALEAERPAATHSAVISSATPRPAPEGPSFPVKVSGGRAGEVVVLSSRRLVLHTDAQLPDNHLEELEVQLPDAPLKLWVRVTHSSGVGANGRAEAEATPFAPTAEVALRLKHLCGTAAPSPMERAA